MTDTPFEWDETLMLEWADFLATSQCRWTDVHGMAAAYPPNILFLNEFKASKQPKPKEPEQREWDIVSFRSKNNQKWVQIIDGTYVHERNPTASYSLKEMLETGWSVKNRQLIIESVRRNSDNEVFTVDDKFLANAGCALTIKSFEVEDGNIKVWSEEYGCWWLHAIRKLQKPLFTTTDGVDIFFKDEFWYITPDYCISKGIAIHSRDQLRSDILLFSTQKAASEYVYNEKPIYSIKDFREIIKTFEERIAIKTDNK